MKKSLFSKLVITFATIITLSFVITAAFLSYWFEGYYFEQRKTQLLNECEYIGVTAVKYLNGSLSYQRMEELLQSMGSYLYTDIWLADNYGIVYAVSSKGNSELIGKQILSEELRELRIGKSVEKRDGYSSVFKGPVHTYMVPILYKDVFRGSIIMHTSIGEIKEPLERFYEIIWASASLAIILSLIHI